jgi:hypothetical protein
MGRVLVPLSRGGTQMLIKAGFALGLFVLIRQTAVAPLWAAGIAMLASLWVLSVRPRIDTGAGLTPLMAATCWAVAQMVVMQVLLQALPESSAVTVSMLATIGGQLLLAPVAAVAVSHG